MQNPISRTHTLSDTHIHSRKQRACACIHTYIHTHTNTYINTYTHTHTNQRAACIHARAHAHLHTLLFIYIHATVPARCAHGQSSNQACTRTTLDIFVMHKTCRCSRIVTHSGIMNPPYHVVVLSTRFHRSCIVNTSQHLHVQPIQGATHERSNFKKKQGNGDSEEENIYLHTYVKIYLRKPS